MPQLFDLPQPLSLAIAFLVPLLTQPVSGWLQDDGLPAFFNAAIVILYLLVTSGLCWIIGGKITGQLPVDAAAYFAIVYLISQTPQMQDLETRFMVNVPSPFSLLVRKPKALPAQQAITPLKLRASLPPSPKPGGLGQDAAVADTLPDIAVPPQDKNNRGG